ncbi:hypothetical protein SH139x_000694 [Planctomycetaceae bacterium SH139]
MSFRHLAPPILTTAQRLGLHLLGGAALGLIVLANYYLLIRPLAAQQEELRQTGARYAMLVAAKAELLDQESQLLQQVTAEQVKLQHLLAAIPQSSRPELLLDVVTTVATRSQVEIVAIRPQPNRGGKLCQVQEVMVNLRCEHGDLCRFLDALAGRSQRIWMAELEIRPHGGAAADATAELLDVKLHLQLPQELKPPWRRFAEQCQDLTLLPPEISAS